MAKELSKDDLLKLLGANIKKPRKKRDISEEQREELIARLAKMREKAKEVRVEKAKMKKERDSSPEPAQDLENPARKHPLTIKGARGTEALGIDSDELFEKKFTNRFDKMDDIMSRLDIRMAEMAEAKKAKREAKALEASKVKQEVKQEPEPVKEPPKSKLEQVREEVKATYNYNAIPKLPDYRNMIRKKY